MFKNILVATDLISSIDAPVATAARLARQTRAMLHILHVMVPDAADDHRRVRHFSTGAIRTADEAYATEVRQVLQHTCAPSLEGLPHAILVAVGEPWQAILTTAGEVAADLIVLGPHAAQGDTNGTARSVGRVGSTAGRVISREACPVMVVNRPADAAQLRFRNVLVAVDFSASCECAVCFAARLAAHCNSRLTVFHMLPVPPYPKYTRSDYTADAEHANARLVALCAPYLTGIDTDYRIRAGALPHLELLNAADMTRADLIVMGSHTKATAGKWYPGSVVERASYRSSCPVMVITDPDALMPWDSPDLSGERKHRDRFIHIFTHPGVPPS